MHADSPRIATSVIHSTPFALRRVERVGPWDTGQVAFLEETVDYAADDASDSLLTVVFCI